ncbi:TPA: DNA cytosine methyltransferase [Listeria monocytogenes]|nr:DNA cytosine methyltransferase [Listeria monocytogenes]HAA9070656.1 DNA (cytosine-5-)-methyltransferase [Listeria monocytogenes]HDI4828558.1 DNA cytosine methyltransferase [Listeria monocytogenes]HDM9928139.1 DNA cytosine methyltransferase [Listeria monocytogenes]
MLTNIELFAGAGGLLDGFEQTDKYQLLAAVEWLKPQVKTLVNRLENKYEDKDAEKKVLNFDIQRTEELINGWNDIEFGVNEGLDKLVGENKVDVISGGPPCQAYSLAGRIRDEKGMREDYRNFLFEAYLKIVEYYKPKIVVFENVEGILSAIPTGEKITDLIRKGFNDAGYEIVDDLRKYALIDLSKFGVPQKRKRVIIIGIRKDNMESDYQSFLHKFYQEFLSNYKEDTIKTVFNFIGDLPPIYPLNTPIGKKSHEQNNSINGHYSRFHNLRDQEIFYKLAMDIKEGTNKFVKTNELIDLYFEVTGKKTKVHKYHVLRLDRPSNTIPAHLKKDGLRHIHPDPEQKRSISIREAARLQTFDDDFTFNEGMGASFEMIGNAVPPLFATKLGNAVSDFVKYLEREEKNRA